ncbi:MAG: hypothetical protein JWQ34_2843 [Mucilaginibacter sp.]|uniref:hypothetical protein n=1 Tax=Mucilaginibacter sp. TaxID=1882438 RepID=UPI002608B316|nr:hypothetical protein [Mucilaginibacter sp.]MDB5004618.1 hypothetical protein [Mucilaginibacter sp.]
MKNIILPILLTFITGYCSAQQIVERKNKLTGSVTEQFQSIIETDKQVKQGMYHAFFAKKTVIASGAYKNDKRIGTWHFFDPTGKIMQNYDYDNNQILYESREDEKTKFRYNIDYIINKDDVTTKPVRLGGRYFGYIPYLRLFKLPGDLADINPEQSSVILELLISPMGRLADYTIRIKNSYTGEDIRVLNINIDLLADEDKIFIPATLNKSLVSSQIKVACYMNRYGDIDID